MSSPAPRPQLLGIPFDPLTEAETVGLVLRAVAEGQGGWIVPTNLDVLRQVHVHPQLRELHDAATLVVADGMPLIWASRALGQPLPERVAGSSLIWSLPAAAARTGASIYLLGGNAAAAAGAAQRLRAAFPRLRLVGHHCPPLGFDTDPAHLEAVLERVAAARPDLVFVALGFPKQERVIARLRERLPAAWFVGCGISLSFVAGDVRRAPAWMQRTGLEWLHRLGQEPRRLARRYLVDDLPFALRLAGHVLRARLAVVGRRRRGRHGR